MAIYHSHVQVITRGKGKSAVASAAYQAGAVIKNEYDGMVHDYTRKRGIVHAEILLPDHAPRDYYNRAILWNAVEKIEKASNAQLARGFDIALPMELTREQNIALARDYVSRTFAQHGMCVDLCVQNGTLNLQNFARQDHNPTDYITKMTRVRFDPKAKCPRWERFVEEIMCGDQNTAIFLQKALGYALTGDTNAHNSFYILYGQSTRNGKSTLTEAIGHILGDYSRTIQPQTLAKRSSDGAAPSPDIARLKGARFVCTPEPEKGLELNSALMKQLTGGDTYVGRFLNENPFEFVPEFHIFFNTNHLPHTNDDTIFASGRVKIIPFERHFTAKEQDHGLKGLFRKANNKSEILNWLIAGYRLMLETGMDVTERMQTAFDEYRSESDLLGGFLAEKILPAEGEKLQTSALYAAYTAQIKLCATRPMSVQQFVGEVRKRYEVGRDRNLGTVIYNAALAKM